ncbi:MAG TPA: hypothetical protein VEB64_18910 [Azospirillaceae bacterium]|nr:hypothetical protein [Azospirillaceae bacterium]
MSESRTTNQNTEAGKHAAGGPGKASKEGHIAPSHGNKPGQNQTQREGGPGKGPGHETDDRRQAPG